MGFGRRRLFQASVALLPTAALMTQARADTTDLVLACDPDLAPAMVLAASAYLSRAGVHVRVFPTSPGLIVPQLEHEVQNDIVVSRAGILDQAARAGLLPGAERIGPWRNPLVIAALHDSPDINGVFAVTDLSPASMLDGHAVLAGLARHPSVVLGAVDTSGVAFLISSRAAASGLLYRTDARANRFAVLATVSNDVFAAPPVAAAISRSARRPNPDAFLAFLASPDATNMLNAAGLERAV
jgi:molybdate transport system substrate-binding protein